MKWASTAVTGSDLDEILAEALARVTAGLRAAPVDLAFLFLSREHTGGADRALAEVRRALGEPHVLGCGASGVIAGGREHEQVPALSLLVGHLPAASVHGFSVTSESLPDPDAPPGAWHETIGLSPADRPSFVLVGDPLTLPAERLLEGLDFAYPGSVIVGGMASGARRAGQQVLLAGGHVLREGAAGVALMGNVEIVPAVTQGCRMLGSPMRITQCAGHLLERVDHQPVLTAMQTAIAEAHSDAEVPARRSVLLGFEVDPLARRDEGPWLVRNLLGIDPATGGVWVGEALRPGQRVRFHVRDRAAAHVDLERALARADGDPTSAPAGALLFSHVMRGRSLYGEPDHDARVFQARFPATALGGFFSDGEIGPAGRSTRIHGYASAFGLFGQRGSNRRTRSSRPADTSSS